MATVLGVSTVAIAKTAHPKIQFNTLKICVTLSKARGNKAERYPGRPGSILCQDWEFRAVLRELY